MPSGIYERTPETRAAISAARRDRYGALRPNLARERNPTTTEIYWAAGIYEGEGSVTIRKEKQNPTAQVAQKDPWILERFREMFGGSIYGDGQKHAGIHCWQVSGARARGFLMTIYGLLSPRRQRQIRIALGKEAA